MQCAELKNPLSVAETSSMADALGTAPVALIPTFCAFTATKMNIAASNNISLNCIHLIISWNIKIYKSNTKPLDMMAA